MTDLIFNNVQKVEQFYQFQSELIEFLKKDRKNKGISEQEMAKLLGISRNKLRGIEKCEILDIQIIMKYCEKNKIDVAIVVTFDKWKD